MDKGKGYRPHFHIQPPKGWLNDPNGSVCYQGLYHIFFQYAPDSPLGSGRKCWGHYTSEDLVHFTFEGISIYPDHPMDKDGVYSGTAWIGEDGLELYYTGNVKHPGNYDYINEGRGHNVLRVKTKDGFSISEKELLLENKDYPSDLSCHVRDPKIFFEKGRFHMLLGARSRDSHGGLLLMKSEDRDHWEIEREFFPDDFGFMLECPDYFEIDGQKVVAFCPQGVESQDWHFQNIYNSGYIFLSEDLSAGGDEKRLGEEEKGEKILNHDDGNENLRREIRKEYFREWDLGFDFYAPQTFATPDGRRILIGWAGVPDVPYGNHPSIEEGWQHTMTLPRELSLRNGRLYSQPVRELAQARGRKLSWDKDHKFLDSTCLDIMISAKMDAKLPRDGSISDKMDAKLPREEILSGDDRGRSLEATSNSSDGLENAGPALHLKINDDLCFEVDGETGMASLRFLNDTGDGRDVRKGRLTASNGFENLRLVMDRCMIELYLNDGELVFTSRFYPKDLEGISLSLEEDYDVECYEIEDTIHISE